MLSLSMIWRESPCCDWDSDLSQQILPKQPLTFVPLVSAVKAAQSTLLCVRAQETHPAPGAQRACLRSVFREWRETLGGQSTVLGHCCERGRLECTGALTRLASVLRLRAVLWIPATISDAGGMICLFILGQHRRSHENTHHRRNPTACSE
ncbi:hypothetical protein BC628DRAFT_831709 [Trametes gibbosa]|nr:hypothetical protein BC628DRAFT_831709 [Trametes gibbosa]